MAKEFDASEYANFVATILHCKAEKKKYDEQEERAWNEILNAAPNDVEVITLNGRPVFEVRRQEQRRIDVARLRAEHPELAQQLTLPKSVTSKHVIEDDE